MSNSENNSKNDQDTSAAEPVEESVDPKESDDPTGNVGEVKHAETDTSDSLRHNMSDQGSVIGRRNPDIETETQA